MSKKHELIFIDGESTDGTWEWLKKQKSLKALQTKKGRARQLNLGAEKTTHDVLYFVHVDTLLPKCYDQLIQQALQKGAQTGCFQLPLSVFCFQTASPPTFHWE
jgi:glycosyltransferase involved in cell wall biosynthesis